MLTRTGMFLTNRGLWQRVVVSSCFAIGGAALAFMIILFFGNGPVLELEQFHATNDAVRVANGRLNIVVEGTGMKNCEVSTSRWLWTWVNDPVEGRIKFFVPLRSGVNTILDAGEHMRFMVSIDLPEPLQDGEWYYFARSVARCNWIGFPSYIKMFTTPTVQVPIKNGAVVAVGPK